MNKVILRSQYLEKRKNISKERRVLAISKGTNHLLQLCESHDYILSYASFKDEFCTWKINKILASKGKLLLPRITPTGLQIFKVNNLEELEYNSWGIAEPKLINDEVPYSQISLSFIPGIAFDHFNHRIGYGKGYYDRLLSQFPHCSTIGIGFEEQLHSHVLPKEMHDIPLSETFLF